jgi:zinc protease
VKRFASLVLLLALTLPSAADAKPKKAPEPPPPAPVEPAPPPPDPEAWRATAPGPGPERAWAPPAATTVTLANGIPVHVVQNDGLPLVSVRLVMKVGREANPAGKAGLGALTANLLDEGTKRRTATQIASEASALGADLSVGAGDELAYVSLDALLAELPKSLDLMADVALQPKFGGADVTRVKAETLTSIQSAKAEPRDVVGRTFAAALYGADHPYGTPTIGSEASVSALKAGDVKSFYKTWWHAGNAAFVVTGKVDAATVKAELDARFGAWKAGKATRLEATKASVPVKTRVVFVEQPGAVQSVLRVGTVGPARTGADFMAANMAGTLVGGMFSSPINMNLREDKGWSYGAFGGFNESRDAGLFAVRTQVQADKTAPAIDEILKELATAAANVPSDKDLTMARDYLLKSLPGNFETNAATAGSFLAVPQFGLPADFWASYGTQVSTVDGTASAAAARTYFDAKRMLIVVAGPRTVTVKDAEGKDVTTDIVAELKARGFEFVEVTAR